MKKNVLKTEFAVLLLLLLFSLRVAAQDDNNNITTQTRDVATLDGLKVSGIFNVIFTQGEPQSVKIEANKNLMENISTEVKNGILTLDLKGNFNYPGILKVLITAKDFKSLDMNGASWFTATNIITTPQLNLDLSGATAASFIANAPIVKCTLSGAAKLELKGTGNQLTADISGASELHASKFEVKDAKIKASGASAATVNPSNTRTLNASGASTIKYTPHESMTATQSTLKSTATINGEQVNVESKVEENTDATEEANATRDSTLPDQGNRNKVKVKLQFLNPKASQLPHKNWMGLYIGVSGYLTPSGKLDPPVHDNFMSLNLIKSTNIQFNFFEQNLKFGPHAGLVTGLGIDWRNYRFEHRNVVLKSNVDYFDGVLDPANTYRKSKLLVTYVTVPLLFQFQTNGFRNSNSFHIAGGVSSGLRIGSHSKVKIEKLDDGTQKSKDRDDFNLNPFKLDATVLIGWGVINLYGNYALIDMFKKDKGPELRPFSVGFRLQFD